MSDKHETVNIFSSHVKAETACAAVGNEITTRQTFAYTLILIPVSLLLTYPFSINN
ncbi:MAG: hypothetical protein RM368_14505 [Nostoc sp. DedSLP03]|uniref:hypothetical protein n=1 Tax=Nostoc sp. DedSLP03 TaxID=3075400 RepID=UPI002AD21029|nr:hypothetical protein [Nostoc sp. DedSLP03]MDZ7966171.1 hypothetical protein [Nostoc sp. DedSLP03]